MRRPSDSQGGYPGGKCPITRYSLKGIDKIHLSVQIRVIRVIRVPFFLSDHCKNLLAHLQNLLGLREGDHIRPIAGRVIRIGVDFHK